MLDPQHHIAGSVTFVRREVLLEAAADHPLHEGCFVERRRRLGRHVFPVAQHGDAVAEAEDLRHAMGDVDHRHAAFAQPVDQGVQLLDFLLAERAGRLVEDDHPGPAADRGGDLHHLLLGDAQALDPSRRVDVRANRLE